MSVYAPDTLRSILDLALDQMGEQVVDQLEQLALIADHNAPVFHHRDRTGALD
jgi:hypothetical protein